MKRFLAAPFWALAVDTVCLSSLEYASLMRFIPLALAVAVSLFASFSNTEASKANTAAVKPVPVAAPLPLALDDSFQVEKVFSVLVDPAVTGAVSSTWLQMESARRYFGAINSFEQRLRDGHSYTIHWRVRPAAKNDVTVRFEYRQQKLGSHVQTKDATYSKASGSMQTEFTVQGDEYQQDGSVTAWRVLLIQAGRVVGLQQSFLW